MIEKNVEISGENTESLYEFICRHNIAFDGLRLGQRFVNIYCKKPWQSLFYEESDKQSMEIIQKFLTRHHYFDKMPTVPTRNNWKEINYEIGFS